VYTPERLEKFWARLHAGDAEPFPAQIALQRAWIAYHAGDFESAARQGLDLGPAGYALAHKATCIYATYLETDDEKKIATFEEVAERCERHQAEQPDNPAAWYWHAYALGRHAQKYSVLKALGQGIGGKVADSLNQTLTLAPTHADVHVALGVFHAEIIDKVGSMIGALTYGVKREEGFRHFRTALALNHDSAIARIEYARALIMLEGDKKMAESLGLFEEAAECRALDARERLDVEAAKEELSE
jgi:tetratricopeptide (TPR) repeat protein